MATLAVAAGAAALGGTLAWGAGFAVMTGIALGWSVGAMIGQRMFGQSGAGPQDQEGPRLDSLSVQSSAYGEPIPIIYGTVRAAGNIIWSTGLKENKSEEEVPAGGGGKGGGSMDTATKTTYSYTASLAVGLCEGEIIGINRIWMDGKLFTQSGSTSFVSQFSGADKVSSFSMYTGSETQEPDPVIEAVEGEGNAPAYRGLAYIVFEDLKLEDYGRRIPNIEVEIAVGLISHDFAFDVPDGTGTVAVFDNGYIACGRPDNHNPDAAWLDIINTEGKVLYHQSVNADSNYLIPFRCPPALNEELSEPMTLYMEHQDDDYYVIDAVNGEVKLSIMDLYGDHLEIQNPNAADIGFNPDYDWYLWIIWDQSNHELGLTNWSAANGSPGNLVRVKHCSNGPYVKMLDNYIYICFGSVLYEYNSWDDIPDDLDSGPGNYNRKSDVSETSGGDFVAATPKGDFLTKNGNTCYVHQGIGPEIQQIYTYETGQVNPVSVKGIVAKELERAGLESTEYDLSDMSDSDELTGFAVTEPMSADKALKPLMRAFQFDIVESDWKIYGTARGQSVSRTIPKEDLAVREQGSDAPPELSTSRANEKELPTEIVVQYQDKDLDYQVGSQRSWRNSPEHEEKRNVRLPMVMSATEAKKIADKLMKIAWIERTSCKSSVLVKHFDLLPSNVLEIKGQRLIVNELAYKMPGLVEISGVTDDVSAYQSDVQAEAGSVPEQQVDLYPPTFSVFLDLPSLQGENLYQAGFWAAAFAIDAGWNGAVIYRSLDDGTTWNGIASANSMATVFRCNSVLGDGPTTRWDYENTLNLRMLSYEGSLESKNKKEVLAGGNTLVLRNNSGELEVISFTDVVEEDDGSFTISGLIRGRKGTERNTNIHQTGEYAVLIEEKSLSFIPISDSDIGSSIQYMVITNGVPVGEGSEKGYTCNAASLKPYFPVHVKSKRDSSGNIDITWLRRVRGTGGWLYVDVPLKEENEKYEVDILDSDGNVKRTVSTSGEDSDQSGITYTASQQDMDFGSLQSSVDVAIYQINATVGRGDGKFATV